MNLSQFHIALTLLVLGVVVVAFLRERYAAHLVAMGAMVFLLLAGVLDTAQVLAVFSNPAPVTIAAMFVIAAALDRTGVLDAMGRVAVRAASRNRVVTLALLIAGVTLLSAFLNNTPLVMVMTPVLVAVALKLKTSPSRLLMPTGYAIILGGSCSMIGTSTNLLVDGVGRTLGQAPFGLLEIFLPGLLLAAAGLAFMALAGRHLLPDRPLGPSAGTGDDAAVYLAELAIPPGSPLAGRSLNEAGLGGTGRHEVVDLLRSAGVPPGSGVLLGRFRNALEGTAGGPAPQSALRDTPLAAGDHLLVRADREELLAIRRSPGVVLVAEDVPVGPEWVEAAMPREAMVTEGVVGPGSPAIGRGIGELRWRRMFGCQVLALHRSAAQPVARLDALRLQQGDRLLLEGPRDELEKLFRHADMMSLGQLRRGGFDRRRAPLAIGVLAGVVLLAAFGVLPIAGLALAGAMLLVACGCVRADEAFAAVQWRVLLLVFGMLGISTAMEHSGAARLLVEQATPLLQGLGPLAALAFVYLSASLLTEVMSNNAVALLLTGIAIGLAESLGLDPRPFMVAVMFGASASFATPVGYQVNTLVYAAGNYRFGDFLRVGIPLKLVLFVVAMVVIPAFWDLQPLAQRAVISD